jgi:predicted PurR-regulated permease PerM
VNLNKREKKMQADLVFVILFFFILAIIFVVSRLNEGIKLLNNRVNMRSGILKKMKKWNKEVGMPFDEEDAIKNILDSEFK